MLISLNWIRELCPFETAETPVEIGARFSLHTAEVEHAAARGEGLERIVAARVLAVKPHPAADRLTVVTVDPGGPRREVVCGAPGVREGRIVPYAAPGTVAGGKEIREATVRGVVSHGMLLSEKELGASDEGGVLWDLPAGTAPGTPVASLFPALRDVILEVDNKSLTHRPDLWGHQGIARELSAIYRVPLAPFAVDERLAAAGGTASVRVSFEGPGVGGRDGLCRRYCGLQIDGVKVGPSPDWLRHRLHAVGARPINNVVDVTNHVLFELGQPLHAFDTTRVEGGEIRVRRARPGERLALLDGSEAALGPEDLVIADARRVVALAGVMGGAGSQIEEGTTSVFLESANFAPAPLRRTSVRTGKRTDSSLRFEKSLDPANARTGILRAAKLLLDLCPGARVVGPLQDVGFEPPPPIQITTSPAFIARRLGAELEAKDVRGVLERLGFVVNGPEGGGWKVTVPSWRATKDVSIPEDLVEEVGRIHGYDRIRPFAPLWTVESPRVNEHRRFERLAKDFLALHAGLSEVITYPMVGAAHCRAFGLDPDAHLKLVNPMSEDMDRLRREIVPVHLEKARDNQRYSSRFGFFELGRVYRKPRERMLEPELPDERSRLAGVLSFEAKSPANFYEVRHIVVSLLERLRAPEVSIEAARGLGPVEPWAHPAVYARIVAGGKDLGGFYRVHPATEARLELEGDVLAFDLEFDGLFKGVRREVAYRPPLRFPLVPFDVAVVAPERTPAREILGVIEAAAGDLLRSAEVFDVFRGGQVGEGKKSVAFHLAFGSEERTLSGEERTAVEARVMEALKRAGFGLRA
ncbi:MAG: phenylalanine--tRNA ligase subunit beta [Planctomycetes bacterium]|nr:phenylalanine--tRNA ligase subunit beta [Planctomycetota bacterium]